MITSTNGPRVEDVASVGTRISWGAILAGAMVALGIYFLLSTVAAAGGMSIHERMDPTKLEIGAVVWAFVMTCAAFFIGGLVTSLFTAGENKMEAMLYGAIMWAVMLLILLYLGASGVHTGFTALAASARSAQVAPAPPNGNATQVDENRHLALEAANRATWYVVFGTWISMFAAVIGALVGAGPTFRIVSITPTQRVVAS